MVCVNTYSLVGEYALDMHHIFSQHFLRDRFPRLYEGFAISEFGNRSFPQSYEGFSI
jgi:hypothetical protein